MRHISIKLEERHQPVVPLWHQVPGITGKETKTKPSHRPQRNTTNPAVYTKGKLLVPRILYTILKLTDTTKENYKKDSKNERNRKNRLKVQVHEGKKGKCKSKGTGLGWTFKDLKVFNRKGEGRAIHRLLHMLRGKEAWWASGTLWPWEQVGTLSWASTSHLQTQYNSIMFEFSLINQVDPFKNQELLVEGLSYSILSSQYRNLLRMSFGRYVDDI